LLSSSAKYTDIFCYWSLQEVSIYTIKLYVFRGFTADCSDRRILWRLLDVSFVETTLKDFISGSAAESPYTTLVPFGLLLGLELNGADLRQQNSLIGAYP